MRPYTNNDQSDVFTSKNCRNLEAKFKENVKNQTVQLIKVIFL